MILNSSARNFNEHYFDGTVVRCTTVRYLKFLKYRCPLVRTLNIQIGLRCPGSAWEEVQVLYPNSECLFGFRSKLRNSFSFPKFVWLSACSFLCFNTTFSESLLLVFRYTYKYNLKTNYEIKNYLVLKHRLNTLKLKNIVVRHSKSF